MILLIDNYDSFSYNLYQLFGEVESDILVIRNDEKTVKEIAQMNPDLIVLSPGPGRPREAGICVELIQELQGKVPIFGVCLGHQAICEAYGATISYAKQLMHGKSSKIMVDQDSVIFEGLPKEMTVARYHSLAVVENTLPESLKVIATTEEMEIMAVEHKEHLVIGVQFHPESILTKDGSRMVQNIMKKVHSLKKVSGGRAL